MGRITGKFDDGVVASERNINRKISAVSCQVSIDKFFLLAFKNLDRGIT